MTMKRRTFLLTAGAVTLFSLGIWGPVSADAQTKKEDVSLASAEEERTGSSSAQKKTEANQKQSTASTQSVRHSTTHYTNAQLEGRKVVTQGNEEIGKIDSLAVDLQNGEVAYAVVSSGGLMGITTDLRVVPMQVIQVVSEGDELTVQLDTTTERWKLVPVVARKDIANLCEPPQAEKIYEFFGLSWSDRPAAKASIQEALPQKVCHLVLSNTVTDRAILGANEQELGKVDNIVVDLESGRLRYILVAPETRFFWNRSDDVYVLSPSSISSIEEERVVVDVTEQQLQNAQELTGENIYRAETTATVLVYRMKRDHIAIFGGRDPQKAKPPTRSTPAKEQQESSRSNEDTDKADKTSEFGSPERTAEERDEARELLEENGGRKSEPKEDHLEGVDQERDLDDKNVEDRDNTDTGTRPVITPDTSARTPDAHAPRD